MLTRRQFHLGALGLGAAALGLPGGARAQAGDYPNRPIRIIVPFAAGGGPDILTRKMAVKLAEVLKGSVVVDNIVGAGGIAAAQSVARMQPDGYNLLLGASSHLVQKAMQPSVAFDPMKDFAHITRTAFTPSVLVVSASSEFKSVEDIVAAAKAAPGKLNYASGGVGSAAHLTAAAMVLQAKIDVVHIPYKGTPEALTDTMTGRVTYYFSPISAALPFVRDGKLVALGVSSAQRSSTLKDVPTIAESALPGFDYNLWVGMFGPAGMPAEIVDRIARDVQRAVSSSDVRERMAALGAEPMPMTPAEFKAFVKSELDANRAVVQAAGIKGQ